MNTKTKTAASNKFVDLIKWILVAILVAAGIFGFHYFSEYSLLLRVVSILILVGIAFFVASTTIKGRSTVDFIRQSHMEVRRVVWPTRQETVQMTGIVILMVIMVALIIWSLDSLLLWSVRVFTGQGG
ncbi:preprotein translocase subunit SecE [Candidatus Halobeggiatoa sp. HSG11]|nr:preprotein translocase subunit SecE [Candidatus Halobeggiatoa sp. HSG11]